MRMSRPGVWALIEAGQYEQACHLADREAAASPSLLPLRNKVLALLNLRRFDEAEALSKLIIERRGGETESDFTMLGIAL